MNKFYVYKWYNIETNYIFYIGKGTRDRYKSKKRNKLFNDYIDKNNCNSEILEYFDIEQDALNYENKLILQLKSTGQCCCNLDNGGIGGLSFVWTEEMRDYISKNNPMKSELQKNRMSTNNPMKNKHVKDKVIEKISRPILINNIEYLNCSVASKVLQENVENIRNWCKLGGNKKGWVCRYKDEEQKDYTYSKPKHNTIKYLDILYIDAIELSNSIDGITLPTIRRWLKNGYDDDGNECRYLKDKQNKIFKPLDRTTLNVRHIYINDVYYNSITEASKILNVSRGYIQQRLNGKRYSPDFICKYANQHPSVDLKGLRRFND